MKASVLAVILTVALSACATYQDGLAAYDAREYERAYRIWLPLAEAGHLGAQEGLGELFVFNDVEHPDLDRFAEVERWLMPCAEQGEISCQELLGIFYQYNSPNYEYEEESLYWYRRAADQGGGYALSKLSVILLDSDLRAYDPVEAMKWAIIFDRLYYTAEDHAAGYTYAAIFNEVEMTDVQVREAERQAAEWFAAHPS